MAHVFLLYATPDHGFARQLAVQIEQRGMVVWPLPDSPLHDENLAEQHERGFVAATHILIILSPAATVSAVWQLYGQRAQEAEKHVVVILHQATSIPEYLRKCPLIDFQGTFLLAFEELSQCLKKMDVPTHPLMAEPSPVVAKPGLLPIRLPAERCWRDDRLRINYTLPVVLTEEEHKTRVPVFLKQCEFKLVKHSRKVMRGRRRHKRFPLFDPRRTEHTLTIRRRKGRTQLYYRVTRLRVYYWFPAHYLVLDREAAALYRYLVTGDMTTILDSVHIQARRARAVAWSVVVGVALVVFALSYVIVTRYL